MAAPDSAQRGDVTRQAAGRGLVGAGAEAGSPAAAAAAGSGEVRVTPLVG